MYLRAKKRIKDGKEHRYWSIVESCRNLDGRVVQRQVLYLGEINDSQKAAWCRTIDVLQTDSSAKQMALFPTDRQAPELDCEVVQVKLNELRLHHPRQWGACWLALKLWEQLELDRFWQPRLPVSRQGHEVARGVEDAGVLSTHRPPVVSGGCIATGMKHSVVFSDDTVPVLDKLSRLLVPRVGEARAHGYSRDKRARWIGVLPPGGVVRGGGCSRGARSAGSGRGVRIARPESWGG